MRTTASPAARVALVLGLLGWLLFALWPSSRPAPTPQGAPASQFSTGRAMVHIEAVSRRPHPVGSEEHARVRDYILTQLARLGVEAQVQAGTGEFAPKWSKGRTLSGTVENVIARIPGASDTRPVLLVAHYDTVRVSPGAGDDGHAVAGLLETARALLDGPRLRNDVILLFTDGEEKGLLGAALFEKKHPWGRQAGIVLNFEAGGVSGPPVLFESTGGNDGALRELRAIPEAPPGNSIMSELYRVLPGDTDLTPFKRAGLPGMNFGILGRRAGFYHRAQDRVENLDPFSVEEQGRGMLALARHFGGTDFSRITRADAVYFPTRLTGLVVYRLGTARTLAWLGLVASIATIWIAWRRRVAGLWMAVPFGLLALLQVVVALQVPSVSYALTWPLLAGIACFAALAAGAPSVGAWRLALLVAAPAVPLSSSRSADRRCRREGADARAERRRVGAGGIRAGRQRSAAVDAVVAAGRCLEAR